jgi:hypothetical protein
MLAMTTPARHPLRAVVLFLLGAAVFAAVYCQAPLYYSNQNQYFLHGLADAGVGHLHDDWLAQTRDPTPAFSAMVSLTVRVLPPFVFHVYYALLFGAYAAAMFALFVYVAGPNASRWPLFVMLFLAAHSALARWGSYRLLGSDYPWFLQAGVAGQYILGAMLQPSAFGVLLVVAVAFFVHDRPWAAAVCIAVTGTMHPSYLLPGALLTLGFLTALCKEGRTRTAFGVGTLTLVLVLPITLHSALTFRPTSPEEFARAQDLLVNVRIPHHSRVDRWLDPIAVLQILWIVLAMAMVWRTRLFLVLAVPFALSVLLTLLQLATHSNTLALLFPWRISAVLVPIATTVVLTRLVILPVFRIEAPAARAICAVVVGIFIVGGIWIGVGRQGFQSGEDELGVMDFVRRTQQSGEVYFVPVTVPDLNKIPRGSLSSDFKPIGDKRQDVRVIPPDLQRFRLTSGAPIFVDFKSIPYKDVEVLEWYARLRLAEEVQQQLRDGQLTKAVDELRGRGVSHVVVPGGWDLQGHELQKVYEDSFYRVYRLASVEDGD